MDFVPEWKPANLAAPIGPLRGAVAATEESALRPVRQGIARPCQAISTEIFVCIVPDPLSAGPFAFGREAFTQIGHLV